MICTIIIGYTTSVFGVFHIDHMNILRKAMQQYGCLIAGVSKDELIWYEKKKRPIIPFADRRAIVEAIKYMGRVMP